MNINLRSIATRRTGYGLSIGAVALIAAWGSYRHQLDVALIADQPIEVAVTLPLSVDGMLLCATLAMAEDKANGRIPRTWARVAFWIGAAISVASNLASTLVHLAPGTSGGMVTLSVGVAAWAPIALLIVTEIMARPGKPKPIEDDVPAVPVKPARTPEQRLEDARRRAGYYAMTPAERAQWTKRYNARIARTAPTSPGASALVPTEAELEEATA